MDTLHLRGAINSAFRPILSIILSSCIAACAIHPLPENVTGVRSVDIVNRIRCEARDAVAEVAQRLEARGELPKLRVLEAIGIVFSFTLTGMETDGLTASATFTKPLTNGAWTYGPSLGDTLMRQNIRTFTVIDNFKELLQLDSKRCAAEPTGPNYQYPIVGTIGVREMVITFVNLAMHEDLSGEQQDTSLSATGTSPPAMADSISFMTTLTAGINPILMLNPVGMAARLTGANVNLSLMRQDIHQVIIGLGLPTAVSSLPPATSQFGLLVSGSARRGSGEDAALRAVNHHILRFEVPKSLVVSP